LHPDIRDQFLEVHHTPHKYSHKNYFYTALFNNIIVLISVLENSFIISSLHKSECIFNINYIDHNIYNLFLSPDKKFFISINTDGTISVWEFQTGVCRYSININYNSLQYPEINFINNGSFLVIDSGDALYMWDLYSESYMGELSKSYDLSGKKYISISSDLMNIAYVNSSDTLMFVKLIWEPLFYDDISFPNDLDLFKCQADNKRLYNDNEISHLGFDNKDDLPF